MSPDPMHQPDDFTLAEKIRNGDRNAFEMIYSRYHHQLFYMAKKYVKSHDLAEDAVQNVFVKLWMKRGSVDPGRSIKSFLFTMLKNHLLNTIRDQKKEIVSVYEVNEKNLPHQNMTEDEIIYNEYQRYVRRGIRELPEKMREVFELKISGHSNSQIAEMLVISVHTVKTQFYHGSKFIRRYLKNHVDILLFLIFMSSMGFLLF